MPTIPLPQLNFEAYNRNTKEQYAALGQFVVAFESMVNETRSAIVDFVEGDSPNTRLIDIALHHSALSAKPLFEIFRTVMVEYLKFSGVTSHDSERDVFLGVLTVIAAEYFTLVNLRNTLLHGTWFVGYSTLEDPNAENFILQKFKPTKTGLEQEDVPKHAFELLALKDRCDDTKTWISSIHFCVPRAHKPFTPVKEQFSFVDGKWRFRLGDDLPFETLPRRLPQQ
jgi:hypothetical protein